MRYNDKSKSYLIGATLGIIIFAFLILSFQSWLLGLILSWFGVQFTFWQCFAIVFLLGCIFGGSRSSK
jgi:hypothetical protein